VVIRALRLRRQPFGRRWQLAGVSTAYATAGPLRHALSAVEPGAVEPGRYRATGAPGAGASSPAGAASVEAASVERARVETDHDETTRAFDAFARQQLPGLSRLAYLLTGDHASAEDLTAEALLAAWNQWDRVLEVDHPTAYLRRIVVNLAAARVRSTVRERRRIRLFHADARDVAPTPDGAAVVDVRAALRQLPARRRACVVLRHAFDLSEEEVARILCVSVGTVKSQTSRGLAQLQKLLTVKGAGDE